MIEKQYSIQRVTLLSGAIIPPGGAVLICYLPGNPPNTPAAE